MAEWGLVSLYLLNPTLIVPLSNAHTKRILTKTKIQNRVNADTNICF